MFWRIINYKIVFFFLVLFSRSNPLHGISIELCRSIHTWIGSKDNSRQQIRVSADAAKAGSKLVSPTAGSRVAR